MGMCGGDTKVKESKGEKAARKVASKQWNDYKKRYRPVEDRYIEQVRSLQKETPLAVSRGIADTAQAYDPVRKRREAQLMAKGVNPNSGRFAGETQDLGLRRAKSAAGAANEGRQGSQDRFLEGLMSAVKNGRDIAASANQGFRARAEQTAQKVRSEAAYEEEKYDQNMDLIGTAAGGAYRNRDKIGESLSSAWDTGSTFATQAGKGTWGDPFAGPRQL